MSVPDLAASLSQLYQMVDSRVSVFKNLLHLSGQLLARSLNPPSVTDSPLLLLPALRPLGFAAVASESPWLSCGVHCKRERRAQLVGVTDLAAPPNTIRRLFQLCRRLVH